jgi:choline dehydrogenase
LFGVGSKKIMLGGAIMDNSENHGEAVNALIDGAYAGRIDRRTLMRGLIACGISAAAARDMADHAAYAQTNQTAQLANLRSEYDYIIVGAGSAGCVMAHRLSQDGRFSVLVIEGGGSNLEQEKIINPMLYVTNFGTDTDWGNKTIPQANLKNRTIVAPIGKIIGGGSSINATVWLKGDKADYDTWEAAAGGNWGFASIIKGFKRVERYAGGESEFRGGSGMIATRKPGLGHPVTVGFIESAKSLGKTEHLDINDIADLTGATGQQDINVDINMRRISAAHAYLLPALTRNNLTLLPNTTVTRLDISAGDCRGVSALVAGETRHFSAAKEVILSAGGLHSPKILMLSGVGPADHLRQIGIPVVADAPAVGANLHDHLLIRLFFATREKLPPRADTGHAGITYHRTSEVSAGPNIQIFGRSDAPGLPDLKPEDAYMILPGLTKPKSRGTVRLISADPLAPIAVDPNYLGDPADIEAYVAGVEFAIALGNAKGFDGLRSKQITLPGADKTQIAEYIRSTALTYFHFVGTCAMGTSASAPVDEALRLRGVGRLRVVDASVMPTITCCNTNAPTLSLAERAADIVLATS